VSNRSPAGEAGDGLGWTVLSLVFLDELLAMAAVAVWGWHVGGSTITSLALAVVLPLLAMTAWWVFASPKAPWGDGVVRPVAKVVVFGLACLGLWDAGHPGWAVALLVFSVVVNALALLPSVRRLVRERPDG
jgi:Protein of unknown function (DUF2568)